MKNFEKFKIIFQDVFKLVANEKQKLLISIGVVSFMLWGLGAGILFFKVFQDRIKQEVFPRKISILQLESELVSIDQLLKNECARPFILKCEKVSPDQAKEKFISLYPQYKEAVEGLKHNPFPQTLDVEFDLSFRPSASVEAYVTTLRSNPNFEVYPPVRERLKGEQKIMQFVRPLGMVFLGFMMLAMGVVLHRFVTHFVFDYKREIEILKWVGATDRFIIFPYVVMGSFLSLVSFGVAWLFLCLGFYKINVWSFKHLGLDISHSFFSWKESLGFTLMFVALGAWASFLAVKKNINS